MTLIQLPIGMTADSFLQMLKSLMESAADSHSQYGDPDAWNNEDIQKANEVILHLTGRGLTEYGILLPAVTNYYVSPE